MTIFLSAFAHAVCIKLLISKALSLLILAGALVVKIPQILKIWPSGKVTGLAPSMFMLETLGYRLCLAFSARHSPSSKNERASGPNVAIKCVCVCVYIVSIFRRMSQCSRLFALVAVFDRNQKERTQQNFDIRGCCLQHQQYLSCLVQM